MALLLRARLALLVACATGACTSSASSTSATDAITSNDGNVLEFRFEASVIAPKDAVAKVAVVEQLQYLQGILTTDVAGNAWISFVELSNVVEQIEGDKKRISYAASLPVIWPKGGKPVPTTYDLALPLDVTAYESFNAKYDGKCGKHEYGQDTFWHDFNPKMDKCTLAPEDVVQAKSTVAVHPRNTQGASPEYNLVWADGRLDIVAVYGSLDDTSTDDVGERNRQALIEAVSASVTNATRTEGSKTESILRETTVTGELQLDGQTRHVKLTAFYVESLSDAKSDFDERYGPLSAEADVVMYSGHSGLSKNIRAMATKTQATKGKYQLVHLNGCQSLAYLGTEMHDLRRKLNGADVDPNGTKFMDVIANALPALYDDWSDDIPPEVPLYNTILARKSTFNELLKAYPVDQLAAVLGEDDNSPASLK